MGGMNIHGARAAALGAQTLVDLLDLPIENFGRDLLGSD